MVIKIRMYENMIGDGKKIGPHKKKKWKCLRKGRRSIHVNKDIKKGDIIKKKDIIF